MIPIATYLEQGMLPQDINEARKISRQAARFVIIDRVMYRKGYSMPLLQCVTKTEAELLMIEVHEGFCGNHTKGQSLA